MREAAETVKNRKKTMTPEQLAAAERKEADIRKKKTLKALKRLTKSPSPPESDSEGLPETVVTAQGPTQPPDEEEDSSEPEESVTAAVLSIPGVKMKKKGQEKKKTTETAPPRRTGRKRMPKTWSN